MNGFTITPANFASMPVGILIVWGIMKLLDSTLVMSTRAKVLVQLGVSLLYSLVAALLFMNGSTKELLQQGVILFLTVSLAQVFGYETLTKMAGVKGDSQPLMIRRKTSNDKNPKLQQRGPTRSQYSTASAYDNPFVPKEKSERLDAARAPYQEFSEQGREDGRI
jgi:hypothetical protein